MLKALSSTAQAPASSQPKPTAKATMTFGLERDRRRAANPSAGNPTASSISSPGPASTSKYNPLQDRRDPPPAGPTAALPQGKPKTLLSSKCSELKTSKLNVLHSVELRLTSYHEVLVFKRPGDKSHSQTVLRRHSVVADSFKEHPILPNAMLVEEQGPVLKHYVYQMEKDRTLKQWMSKIASCKKKASAPEMPPQQKSLTLGRLKNGVTRNLSLKGEIGREKAFTKSAEHYLTSSSSDSRALSRSSSIPGKREGREPDLFPLAKVLHNPYGLRTSIRRESGRNLHAPQNGFGRDDLTTTTQARISQGLRNSIDSEPDIVSHAKTLQNPAGFHSASSSTHSSPLHRAYSHGPGSPEPRYHTALAALGENHTDGKHSTSDGTVTDSSIGKGGKSEEISVEDVTVSIIGSEDGRRDSSFSKLSSDSSAANNYGSEESSLYLSRNSSARSSEKSIGNVSVHSLNLSVLSESLVASFQPENDGKKTRHASSSSYERLTLNLAERKERFVRRASDQLAGLFKVSSFREQGSRRSSSMEQGSRRSSFREQGSRKSSYVRISSSASELDSLCSPVTSEPNFLSPPRPNLSPFPGPGRTSRSGGHTPPISATPTSPLEFSCAAATPTSSLPEGETPEAETPGTEEEGEAFVPSKFHHTQIRNRKWKQSPRIQRNLSCSQQDQRLADSPALSLFSSPGVYGRALSESPTAALGHTLHNSDRRSRTPEGVEVSPIREVIRASSGVSTLPRSRRGRRGRHGSETGNTTPGSPVASSKFVGSKSPKILRIFHKRQSSNASGKVHLFAESLESNESDLSSSFSLDFTPRDHTPRKLHLFPAKDVAMELTLMDSELLRKIRPEELVDGAWIKKDTKEEKSPNVLQMVRSFNQLALLVPTEVLSENTAIARAKVISAFIKIAQRCYSLRNYNSLKALVAGLQCTPIYRLKRTWKEITSRRRKHFEQLCALMSESDNWQQYRQRLEEHVATSTPFIPFLGMFLTQVVQHDSYHQIRQQQRPHPAGHTPNNHQLQVLPLGRPRKRSNSLGDRSTASTLTPPSLQHLSPPSIGYETPPIADAKRFSYVVKEEDNVFMDNPLTDVGAEEGGVVRPTHTLLHTPTPDHTHPNIEIEVCAVEEDYTEEAGPIGVNHTPSSTPIQIIDPDQKAESGTRDHAPSIAIEICDEDGLSRTEDSIQFTASSYDETDADSALDGSSLRSEGGEMGVVNTNREEIDLEDISFGFKRRSRSFESLMESFRGDRNFQYLFQREPVSLSQTSLHSQSYSSDEDEEGCSDNEDTTQDATESSIVESDCVSDLELTCSFNMEGRDDGDPLPTCPDDSNNMSVTDGGDDGDDPLPTGPRPTLIEDVCPPNAEYRATKSHSLDDSLSHSILEQLPSEATPTSSTPVLFQTSGSLEECSFPTPTDEEEVCKLSPINTDTCPEEGPRTRRRLYKAKRSRSQDSGRRVAINKPKNKAKGVQQLLRRPKQPNYHGNGVTPPTLASAPTDMLIQFQIASMGCVMGVGSKVELRVVLKDSETNSEKENYSISREKEAD